MKNFLIRLFIITVTYIVLGSICHFMCEALQLSDYATGYWMGILAGFCVIIVKEKPDNE